MCHCLPLHQTDWSQKHWVQLQVVVGQEPGPGSGLEMVMVMVMEMCDGDGDGDGDV